MAREIVYTDDLSGEIGAEPVKIGWNEVWFEVDLAEANRTKLTEFIEEYINAGRPAESTRVPEAASAARTRAPRGTGQAKAQITEEQYGEPRRGRASAEEANYVRNNLAEVNERLKTKGMREIDPADQKMKDRYGL